MSPPLILVRRVDAAAADSPAHWITLVCLCVYVCVVRRSLGAAVRSLCRSNDARLRSMPAAAPPVRRESNGKTQHCPPPPNPPPHITTISAEWIAPFDMLTPPRPLISPPCTARRDRPGNRKMRPRLYRSAASSHVIALPAMQRLKATGQLAPLKLQ
ncbi:unnamed protein product [Pleuronectes platessa]|uniref:Uncharacterized protein n=1 Tax=Pleuronectes platessa TaxID=8262 RepID=A0A9N7V511_PLEPL|nr:unnamed protein product [Pleuronectes platessa]